MATKIPKKFGKFKKSFVDTLSKVSNTSRFSAFCAFPVGVSFNGQDDKEHIIVLMRKHLAAYIPQFLLIIFLLFTPSVFGSILNELVGKGNISLMLGITLFCGLMVLTVAIDTFFKWYYSVNIITDERIIDVDFVNILFHRYSEAQLERIEDVTHQPAGILSTIFDYGNVYIQTAGTKPEFIFDNVPRARDVQDTLLDLLELKQEGKI